MARDRRAVACVLGDMDLVRPLGQAGIRCAVVASPGQVPTFSRFTDVVLEWAGDLTAGGVDDAGLLALLLDFAARQDEPPVLFYQHDEHALFIARHRVRLESAFRFLLPPTELLEDLVDKARFMALAQELDLPVPSTRVLDTSAPVPPDLPYPLILKPPTRGKGRWGSLAAVGKAVRADSEPDLVAQWPHLRVTGKEIVAQELVEGPESRIESYHAYVDPQGAIAGEFTGRKLRTHPREYGFTTAAVTTDAPDVRELGRSVVRALGFAGVSKADFKRGPDDRLHLLEINPRFNLWHHVGAVAGVNLPALVWADLTGRPRPPVGPARPDVRWCSVRDRIPARAAGMSRAAWLSWALRCEAKSNLAWDDPALVLGRGWWELRRRPGIRRSA